MDWKKTLRALDSCCAENKFSNAFRDAMRVKLIEKALMPIVGIEPIRLHSCTINNEYPGVRFCWKDDRAALLCCSQVRVRPFLVYQPKAGLGSQIVFFVTEKEAAEEVLRLLKKI